MPVHNYSPFLDQPYEVAGRQVDPVLGTVAYQNKSKHIRRKELELLALLACADGQLVKREEFIGHFWEHNPYSGEQGLSRAMAYLRATLDDKDKHNPLIRTVPRQGYQLYGQVHMSTHDETTHWLSTGDDIKGYEGWQLKKLLTQTESTESWLAVSPVGEYKVFRFCLKEAHLKNLRDEVAALSALKATLKDSSQTVVIDDWQLDEPPYYMSMPMTVHGDLHRWSDRLGGLLNSDPRERLRLIQHWASALACVHESGLVHRNLSPNSLLVDESAGSLQGKLGEFGLAELKSQGDSALSDENEAVVTLTSSGETAEQVYMSPELKLGEQPSTYSDVYALGVLIYQVIQGDLKAVYNKHWQQHMKDEYWRDLVFDCTKKQASSRPDAADIIERLKKVTINSDLSNQVDPTEELPLKKVTITLDPSNQVDAAEKVPQADAAPPIPEVKASQSQKDNIGPYYLLETLGEGGMGVVYLAEQRTPVERKVAIKLIKKGMDSDQILARFEAESQALALMNHLNVASVFDIGVNEVTQPYFVMEYVPGQPITSHSDQHLLNTFDRVRLFLQVCDGVLHAHQKGIIHRDLNPKNIMVKTQPNQDPVVKIIDFGVAKSLQTKLSPHTIHTYLGTFVGTPYYASPEQIEGNKTNMDTRSDIYSLGVVLYELLVGVLPYEAEGLSGVSPAQLAKILSESDVTLPAKRLQSINSDEQVRIASNHRTSVESLAKDLRQEATWIILKCMEANPDDRYVSVWELKRDLLRWLNGQPVEARKTNRWYRVAKFVKRNKLAVGFGAISALGLMTTTTLAYVGYLNAKQATKESIQSAEEAQMAMAFQQNQLKSIDPGVMAKDLRSLLQAAIKNSQGQLDDIEPIVDVETEFNRLFRGVNFTDIALDQLDQVYIDPALETIEKEYHNTPLLQAQLWQVMAEILEKFSQYEKAMMPLDKALEIKQNILSKNHPEILELLLLKSDVEIGLGKFDHAENLLKKVIKIQSDFSGEEHLETVRAQVRMNKILFYQGNTKKSIDESKRLLHIIETKHKNYDPLELLYIKRILGALLAVDGKLEESKRFLSGLLITSQEMYGADHLTTIKIKHNLTLSHIFLREFEEAKTLLDQALKSIKNKYGEHHFETLSIMSTLAGMLVEQKKYEEALVILTSAREKTVIENKLFEVLWFKSGESYLYLKNYKQAEYAFKKVLKLVKKQNNANVPLMTVANYYLARVFFEQGQKEMSLSYFNKNLDIVEIDDLSTDEVRALAINHRDLSNFEDSERWFLETLKKQSENDEINEHDILVTKLQLAEVMQEQNKVLEADNYYTVVYQSMLDLNLSVEDLMKKEQELNNQFPDKIEDDLLKLLKGLADFLYKSGKVNEAELMYQQINAYQP